MSDVATNSETGGWSKRQLRLALLASVALNLLGVGIIGGAMIVGPPHQSRGEFGLKGYAATLPADRGQMLRESFAPHRPKVRALRQAARTARLEATDVLVAEPYDKVKMRASLSRLDEAESQLRTYVSDYFIEASGKLTPDERKSLAQWWQKRQPRLFWRHDDPQASSDGEKPEK